MKDVTIDVSAKGFGTFVVGGVDISNHVRSVTVWLEAGRVSRVEFEVIGDVHLDVKEADVTLERRT